MYSYIYSESCTWKFPMPLSSSSCSSLCFSPRHVTVFYSEQHHQYLTSLSSYCCSQMKSSRGSLCWGHKSADIPGKSDQNIYFRFTDSATMPAAALSRIWKSSHPEKLCAWSRATYIQTYHRIRVSVDPKRRPFVTCRRPHSVPFPTHKITALLE